jgi:TPP-dependent trihydroxycyclohexane-1,2-dione (THcHDO) dehydratase
VADPAELAKALADARGADVPTVIHCPTARDRPLVGSGAFWDLGVPEVGAEAIADAHRAARTRLQRSW